MGPAWRSRDPVEARLSISQMLRPICCIRSMDKPAHHPARADLLLVISAVSFGALPVFGRFAYAQGMNVQSLLATRFLLAGAILGGVALFWGSGGPAGGGLRGAGL